MSLALRALAGNQHERAQPTVCWICIQSGMPEKRDGELFDGNREPETMHAVAQACSVRFRHSRNHVRATRERNCWAKAAAQAAPDGLQGNRARWGAKGQSNSRSG